MSFRFDDSRADDLQIVVKRITLLSRGEREALYRLTHQSDSMMRTFLQGSSSTVVVIGKTGGRIVGWAAIDMRNTAISVFVDPAYRQRGIGKRLGEEAVRQVALLRPNDLVQAAGREPEARALYLSLGFHPTETYREDQFFQMDPSRHWSKFFKRPEES